MDMRWRLFGHVLRLDEKAPANQARSAYFETDIAADPEPASPGRLTADRHAPKEQGWHGKAAPNRIK